MRYIFILAFIIWHCFETPDIFRQYRENKTRGIRIMYYLVIVRWVVTVLMCTQFIHPWYENIIFGLWFLLSSVSFLRNAINEDQFSYKFQTYVLSLSLLIYAYFCFLGDGMEKYLLTGEENKRIRTLSLEDIAHEYDHLKNYYISDSSQWLTKCYLTLIINKSQDEQDECQIMTIGSNDGNIGKPIQNDSSDLIHLGYAKLPQTTLSIYAQTSIDSTTIATLMGDLKTIDYLDFHSSVVEPLDTEQFIFVIKSPL